VFNLTGSEIIFILLIALVVLGPEKLPGAVRRATKTYAELRKMGDSFQSEFKSVLDEPLREMRETANLIKEHADPKKIAESAERELAAVAKAKDEEAAQAVASTDASDAVLADEESKATKIDYFAATLKNVDPLEPSADRTPDVADDVSDDSPGNEDDDDGAANDDDDDYRVASA
jgi:sec-independent protein translocase protein TatB